jgi:hypothetical protein
VSKYPTVKVFHKGKQLEDEPGRDVQSILEYLDKLNTPALIMLTSKEDLNKFYEMYGNSSPIILYKGNSGILECIQKLEENYKNLFYFGAIHVDAYADEDDSERIIVRLLLL